MLSKITGFTISDFKRIRLVDIQPNENGLTILGGRNRQGKSSALDAIAYALGGEAFRPSNINNTESDENANIRVKLNGLVVERKGKNAELKVTDERGMKGNQSLLNEIVSKFALDLGAFINASEKDKAKMLLQMFPELEAELDKLNRQNTEIKDARTEINRDVKLLQARFDSMPNFLDAPAEEIRIEDLTAELQKATDAETAMARKKIDIEAIRSEIERLRIEFTAGRKKQDSMNAELENFDACAKAEADELEKEFIRRRNEMKNRQDTEKRKLQDELCRTVGRIQDIEHAGISAKSNLDRMEAEIASDPNLAEQKADILARIQKTNQTNGHVRTNAERRKVYSEIEARKKESAEKTEVLDAIAQKRAELLKNANLPLPELSINDESELLYNGQKWDCMSDSERLKVATAICMGTKPGCGFVLIDGLETMDSETLAEFGDWLAKRNMQGIGTIVGNEQATVIIEDGCVKESK